MTSLLVLCTLQNWLFSPRCTAPINQIEVTENREVYGSLTSGVKFSQINVLVAGYSMQKFQMERVQWYMTDKGKIFATSDLQALSIYLTK